MTAFADSSAVVKLYSDESHADLVRAHSTFVVSALARVEVVAALWRKERTGQLSGQAASVLADEFEADWHDPDGPFVPVPVSSRVLEDAAGTARRHGLRAYDAVQLASALAVRAAGVVLEPFLCFDTALLSAAAREGFATAG